MGQDLTEVEIFGEKTQNTKDQQWGQYHFGLHEMDNYPGVYILLLHWNKSDTTWYFA